MMTRACWARNIRGRWFRPAPLFLLVWLAAGLAQSSAPLSSLARAYRESPTPARRDALLRFARAHPKNTEGALALLVLGATEAAQGRSSQAAEWLAAAAPRLPQLRDYVSFHLARALSAQQRHKEALSQLQAALNFTPVSPLTGEAALLAAQAHLALGEPAQAAAVLEKFRGRLPQPDGFLALASAYEAAGQLVPAAVEAQRVFFEFPQSSQAAEAERMLARLQQSLGQDYPPPLPSSMLGRAAKWMEARDYKRALEEYRELTARLGGAELQLAQVRLGAAQLLGGDAKYAQTYLEGLSLPPGEADAERLYYLVRCARSLGDEPSMRESLTALERLYPASSWRLEALVWAGNYYVLQNDPAGFTPLFRACYEQFSQSTWAPYCHWKVAWSAWLERRPEARSLLQQHLERFPASDKRPAALYFLGRDAERSSGRTAALPYYQKILEESPNHFYASLAAGRLQPREQPKLPVTPLNFTPEERVLQRILRARLLNSAALFDWAARELRFGASEDGQPHVLALELARAAATRQAFAEAIRHIKGVFPAYLQIPVEAAPHEFWRLAFPIPYRTQLERYAKTHRLDLYLLAGLIRQESEFDPRAVSRAGARGLMQVMPSTGRVLSRQLRLGTFRTSSLFQPDYNLRLGSFYFRRLLDGHEGFLEAALASYNAGKRRTEEWLTWANYQEPAEFIETIPITETRTYVQAVLRNSWLYRRIYKDPVAGSIQP